MVFNVENAKCFLLNWHLYTIFTSASPLLRIWSELILEASVCVWAFHICSECRVYVVGWVGHISAPCRGVGGSPPFTRTHSRSAVSSRYSGILRLVGRTCAVLLLLKDSACFIPKPAFHGTHVNYAGTPRMEFFPSLYSDNKQRLGIQDTVHNIFFSCGTFQLKRT